MKRKITAGLTSVSLPIFIADTTSTTGGGLSGVTHASSGLVIEYRRAGQSSWTSEPPAAKTLGTYVSGGIVADGSLAGAYEVDFPNAAFAAGARFVVCRVRGVANMLPVLIEVELDAVDYQTDAFGAVKPTVAGRTLDVSTGGEAGIDLANVGSPTSTLNLSNTTVGNLTNLPAIPNNWLTAAGIAANAITDAKIASNAFTSAKFADAFLTAAKIATDAITAAKIAADAVAEIQSGLATSLSLAATQTTIESAIAGVQSDTNDIQTRLPAALVGGRMAANAEVVGDKTGYSLTNLTVSSGTTLAAGTHQPQTGDSFARIGANGAGLTSIGDTRLANLDATVSSRASATALTTVEGKIDSLLARITTNLFTGITSLADWIRRISRSDAGTAGMGTAQTEIGGTFAGTTDSLQAIRDRGDAAWTTGSGGGGGSGTGARTVAITVTVDSVLQEGAKVRVTKGVETYIVATNVSGVATFNLDDGTWTIAITAPFATFAGASLVVDADATQTYDMDAVHLSPSDPDKVTAYYLCLDENGDPEAGVEVRMQVKEASAGLGVVDGLAIGDPPRTATSDANGMASFVNVIPGYVYIVSCGSNRQHMVEIPQNADTPFPLRSIVR